VLKNSNTSLGIESKGDSNC